MEQSLSAAHRRLGIGLRLLEEQSPNFLFGDRLALHKFLKLDEVFLTIECDALSFASIAACTSSLLIVAFEALGHIVVDDVAHVGFVDAHTECNGCHDDIDILLEEGVLILATHSRIHTGMIGQRLDVVSFEYLGKLFNLFARKAIDDTRLAGTLLDVADYVAIDVIVL